MQVENVFASLAAFCVRRPRTVLAAAAVAAIASLVLAAERLTLRTSNLDLVDASLPPVQRFLDFANEFGTPNVLVVVLEGERAGELQEAVRKLGPALRGISGVRNVVDRLPLDSKTLARLGVEEFARSHDGKLYCIFIQPDDPHSRAETIEPLVRGVRACIRAAGLPAAIHAGITGLPAYALDDRDIIQRDITKLSLLSFALIITLFIVSFGAFRRPVMAMLSLATGIILTMGFAAFFPGHLTLLSAFFVSILFGLCDDFGIQTVSRMEEFMTQGMTESDAVPAALASLGRGMLTGTITTALAFFAIMLSGFKGFAELGLIAGAGALFCLATTMTVLPALLALFHTRKPRASIHADHFYGRIMEAAQFKWLAIGIGVAGLAAVFLPGPGFDTDYLNLEPKKSEAVRLEREMVKRTDLSPQFAVFVANSRKQAAQLSDKLLGEDSVGEVRSIADVDALAEETGKVPELPPSFMAALASSNGHYAVYAYPQGDVWNPAQQGEFISRMRQLDPNVTGMPILGQFMVDQSQRGMRRAAMLAGLALLVSVALDFRRPLTTLLAVSPTLLAVFSIRALMRALGLSFNPLNVMAIPVIIGLAVNYGVHLVHRFREENGNLPNTLKGTGRSVLLSALTTLVGFGALMGTEHRGLASFAAVMTLGLTAAMIYSVVVLPALLKWLRVRVCAD